MLRGLVSVLGLALCLLACAPPTQAGPVKRPARLHQIYFENTHDELNVYRVYGVRDGKTLMLIGGIQGDEPGGFLSADLYADISLAQGNLIVVPRANFLSIMQNNRGADGDMNRQFGDRVTAQRQKKIVEILKELMAESDFMLNLHDGSGFYRPAWEGPLANPMRFGQSLIADTDLYQGPGGKVIDLKGMAEKILPEVNARIDDPKYHLHFNNHRTSSQDSIHKEQRLSATYYALTHCGIPAFGVESSKSLPNVAMKIRHHNLVINAFMDMLGIVSETPPSDLPSPEFKFLVVKVNDFQPVAVAKGSHLTVAPGDRVTVQHIQANYERGLSCDVEGLGAVNDLGQPLMVNKPTRILVRKDNQTIGQVDIKLDTNRRHPLTMVRSPLMYFMVDVAGQRRLVADGERLRVVRGDQLTLVDVLTNLPNQAHIKVDLKGYAPPGQPNLGEDRGHQVDTDKDLLKRFSLCQAQIPESVECYQVVATQGGRSLASMQLEVIPARLDYLVLRRNGGHKMVFHNGETVETSANDRLEIMDLKSNVASGVDLTLVLDHLGQRTRLDGGRIDTSAEPFLALARAGQTELKLLVMRQEQAIGHVQLKLGGTR
jgi:predicted deacylase